MSCRRALLFRWTDRDRLAVLIVALAVAFLVGTTLVVLAAGTQTAAIAADFESPGQVTLYASQGAAESAADPDDIILPFTEVTTPDGRSTLALARPANSELASQLRLTGDGVSLGIIDEPETVDLRGTAETVIVDAAPRSSETAVPSSWYLAPEQIVSRLGVTGAIVISPGSSESLSGTPLRAALEFFLRGTRQALTALSVAGLGAALLVGVTVFGVTRMGVRDRLETIRIVRATGGTPRTVLVLFTIRAGLLTAVGTALGYALGVILPNGAVSAAIASGQSVSLPLAVTEQVARALVPALVGPIVVGVLAGAIAAYPVATRPPGRIDDSRTPSTNRDKPKTEHRSRFQPKLLDRRIVVPTAATLAAFVVFATVAAGLGTALAPVAAADTDTVIDPRASHPLNSQVPEAYADALVNSGIDASAEILLLEVVDGKPFIAVGADFDRFGSVHETEMVAGRAPEGAGEAVIGTSLATTLDVDEGDRLALGGSTRERLTVVKVVGRFEATGATGSQLVVPLETARHLSGVRPGAVHLVSADRLPEGSGTSDSTVGVVDVSVPARVAANTTVELSVTLQNEDLAVDTHEIQVNYRGQTYARTVEVGAAESRTVTVAVPAGPPGTETIRIGDIERELQVVERDEITITGLPTASPLDGQPQVRVVTLAGDPVPNASVSVGNRSWQTDDVGETRIEFEETGTVDVVATAGDHSTSATIEVAPEATRRLDISLAIQPSAPSVLAQPTAVINLRNPWSVPIECELTLADESPIHTERVTVEPGSTRTFEVPLDRRSPGDYQLTLRLDGTTVAEQRYTVTGDDRLASALASGGESGQSGLSRAIEAALGNLRLVIAVVVGLAGLMTVGATTATFAAGVQARTRTLGVHRATGASPVRVLRLVLRDALVLGSASTVIGLVIGLTAVWGFAELGVLTVLGVRVPPVPSLPLLVGIGGTALGLTLLGATLATVGVLRTNPATLLTGRDTSSEPMEASRD